MRAFKLILISLTILLISCKTNLNKICEVDDPIIELDWLSNIIDNGEVSLIYKTIIKDDKMKRQEAFQLITSFSYALYNCNGE